MPQNPAQNPVEMLVFGIHMSAFWIHFTHKPMHEMHETAALVVRRGRVLLTSESDDRGWWPGLWRLPRVVSDGKSGEVGLRALLLDRFGLTCDELVQAATTTYGVTTNRVTLEVMSCTSPHGRLVRSPVVRWFTLEQALSLGVPAADRRILEGYVPALPG